MRIGIAASLVACAAIVMSRASGIQATVAPNTRAASESLPARLGIGRPATARDVAPIDIDIMPDGRGLPAGQGTAAEGMLVYVAKCAVCHGGAGEGIRTGLKTGPALVGRNPGDAFDFNASQQKEGTKTIGNYWPYATTVFDYVRRAMPFDQPGSLTDKEVWAVTAYLLQKNDLIAEGTVINAKTLPQVKMTGRGHFVRDDREASTRVR
jgi:cytochrome c